MTPHKEFETILANCLVHGPRNFVEVAENFPVETAPVIDQIALVYGNDEAAKQQTLTPGAAPLSSAGKRAGDA